MKINLLVAAMCMASFLSFSQTIRSVTDIDALVHDMRNQQPAYQKIDKLTTPTGSRTVYVDKNELKIITVKGIDQGLKKSVEWYYVNGQLTYSETNWYEGSTENKTYSEKFYLSNGQLIAWMDSDNQHADAFSEAFKDAENLLVAYGAKIKDEAMK